MFETKETILAALINIAQEIKCGGVNCESCPFKLKNCVKFREIIDDLLGGDQNVAN